MGLCTTAIQVIALIVRLWIKDLQGFLTGLLDNINSTFEKFYIWRILAFLRVYVIVDRQILLTVWSVALLFLDTALRHKHHHGQVVFIDVFIRDLNTDVSSVSHSSPNNQPSVKVTQIFFSCHVDLKWWPTVPAQHVYTHHRAWWDINYKILPCCTRVWKHLHLFIAISSSLFQLKQICDINSFRQKVRFSFNRILFIKVVNSSITSPINLIQHKLSIFTWACGVYVCSNEHIH